MFIDAPLYSVGFSSYAISTDSIAGKRKNSKFLFYIIYTFSTLTLFIKKANISAASSDKPAPKRKGTAAPYVIIVPIVSYKVFDKYSGADCDKHETAGQVCPKTETYAEEEPDEDAGN